MLKEKNNKFFEKKEIRKKCFLIRKQSAVNSYYSSFNAAKNFLSLVYLFCIATYPFNISFPYFILELTTNLLHPLFVVLSK